MRNGNKLLVVHLPHVAFRLPLRVIPNDDGTDVIRQTVFDYQATRLVKVIFHLRVATTGFGGYVSELSKALEFGNLFVPPLVDRLYFSALDEEKGGFRLRRNHGCEIVDSQINGARCRSIQLQIFGLSTVIFEGEFQNEGISQRHDTHITYNGFVDLRVERLCLAATDLERLKAVLFTAGEIETMVLDLVAVATDDKGTVPFL